MHQITRRLGLLTTAILFAVSVVVTPVAGAAAAMNPAARPVAGPGAASLPAVAAVHGISETDLSRRLTQDKHLKVGRGRLMYQEAPLTELLGADAAASAPPESGAPAAADAFALHSLPGAKRIIYLDFDGHLLANTAWNDSFNGGADIVCPPWDIEGGSSVFTDTERARIAEIWQRVAEDYIPFTVDVTTEYPGEAALTRSGSSDDAYGMRVLISPISSYVGNYGGVAYVGVFDASGDYYKPALVFPERLANGAKYIAEACSHENGHTLGLYHDGTTTGVEYYAGHGTGETGWAPIMGNGYSRNVTQWSRGEYANANNTEDDFAKIQSNGLSFRTDDMGNTAADATVLPTGSAVAASGRIERNTDVDVMRLSVGAGAVSLTISPEGKGPDLDVIARLTDATGGLVAESNPADMLAATVTADVAEGTYFLSVSGVAKGDPATGYSAYGTVGAYTVSGTVVPPTTATPLPPIAVAEGTPLSGTAPLNVQFDSSASFDPDGDITSWMWEFDDGSTSSAANPSHTFTAAGTYTVRLTVTDNEGLAGSASTLVNVATTNAPPTAVIAASALTGTAPFAVQFSGAGSYDPDGDVVSWAWDFGDGAGASGAATSHTYGTAGTYTVRLTVTDNVGAMASTSALVRVQSASATVVRVEAIQLSIASAKRSGKQVSASVRVTTPSGYPVSGVTVSGVFSGVVKGGVSGVTDSNGIVVLGPKSFRKNGTVTFSVSSLSKSGCVYDPGQNLVTRTSVSTGQATR